MADQPSRANQQDSSYLSPGQQDLLLAALNSQAGGRQNTFPSDKSVTQSTMNSINENGLYMSPQQATLDNFDEFSPDLDYLDGDNFDFENADLGGEMIGALPRSGSVDEFGNGLDLHEKRKNSEDDDETEEGDAKRHETQDGEKSAKKPGRKPLTSEPTTKRKAQNRAAQRAFRERKEKHLKDLETKVSELTKAKEADKHENALLKAQVERLQVDLREYRKRLSLNSGSGANRSPPLTTSGSGRSGSNSSIYGNGFQFEFPKFGALPGNQIFGNQNASNGSNPPANQRNSATPPLTQSPVNGTFTAPSNQYGSRQNSEARSMSQGSIGGTPIESPSNVTAANLAFATYSTNDNMHGFASTLPAMSTTSSDPFDDLFSPSILKSATVDSTGNYFPGSTPATNSTRNLNITSDIHGGDTTAGFNRAFQFNSTTSGSDTASPSASSASQWNGNANSSTGTSPEPSHGSPANKANEKFTTQRHQSPLATSNQTAVTNTTALGTTDANLPSLDTFDPILFGDYRDSQDAIVGGGDFTGGFFDDALQPFDMNSPSNLFGILQSPQSQSQQLKVESAGMSALTPSKSLMAEVEKTRDGGDDEDFGLLSQTTGFLKPSKQDEGKYISCNNIWSQLQSNPDFQEGKFDLDSLCSELKAKARCSESGVMVDQEHVDAALRKLGQKDDAGKSVFEPHPSLMFEQDSWDNVLRKMNNAKPLN